MVEILLIIYVIGIPITTVQIYYKEKNNIERIYHDLGWKRGLLILSIVYSFTWPALLCAKIIEFIIFRPIVFVLDRCVNIMDRICDFIRKHHE